MSVSGAIIIEGHVQGLSNTRSIGELGVPVYVLDTSTCITKFSKYCTKFFICPPFNSPLFIDFLIELGQKEGLKDWILYPSNDFAVINIYQNWGKLKNYYIYFENSIEQMELIYDKEKLSLFAKKNQVPTPEIISTRIDNNDTYPIITRGKYGLSFYKQIGRKALISNNQKEFKKNQELLSRSLPDSNYFSQEIVSSKKIPFTVSYVVFAEKGEVLQAWMGEKIRQHPSNFGTATLARSTWHESCADHGNQLMKALQYTGICEIEFQYSDKNNDFLLIEINARTWLWVELAKASGIDFAKIIFNYFANQLEYKQLESQRNIYWRNFYTDSFMLLKRAIRFKLSWREFFNYPKGKKVKAILQYRDPLPSFAFIFLLPKMIRNR